MNDTDYKTALVTGASSGIGYATVKKLTAKGIKVYATARRINKLKQKYQKYQVLNLVLCL